MHLRSLFISLLLCLAAATLPAQEALVLDHSFGSFRNARRISIDPMGRAFITDAETNQLIRMRLDGSDVKSLGGAGWEQNQFDRPAGLDAHFGIEVYVADYGNHRIQRLDGNLNYIGTLSLRDAPDPASRFGYPLDVAVSRFSDLYIIDSENRRILRVASFSTAAGYFGSIASGEGELHDPVRIAIGPDDNVYVLEKSRVAVFDLFGAWLREIPLALEEPAAGFCVDGEHLYIVSNSECLIHNLKGGMSRRIGKNELLGLTGGGDFRDIAVFQGAPVILAGTTAHVFRATP